MRAIVDPIDLKQLSACVYQINEVLQAYKPQIQLFAIGFYCLEMMEQVDVPFQELFYRIDNVRRRACWEQVQALRAAHLYIRNYFYQES